MDMVGKAEYKMEQIFTSLNSQSAAGAQREALRPEAEGPTKPEANNQWKVQSIAEVEICKQPVEGSMLS